ncbi:nadh dehydrogenase [Nannochloropsis oceanica]
MAFKAVASYMGKDKTPKNPVVQLYRTISKELPRVLTIYDADLAPAEARAKVQNLFRKNSHVGDPVIVDMLVKKGYMELEETLMQWKQKTHLLRLLAADTETPRKYKNKKTVAEKFFSNTLNPDD